MKRYLLLIFALCTAVYSDALTQEPLRLPPEEEQSRAVDKNFDVSLYFENDMKKLSLIGSDHHYTNGMRVSYLFAQNDGPGWAKWVGGVVPPIRRALGEPKAEYNFGLALGHHMYTPTDIQTATLLSSDRPYGGWLYASVLFHLKQGDSLQTFAMDLGVVGPWAQGKAIQNFVHGTFGYPKPAGWAHQLSTEPGINLYYQHKYKILEWRPFGNFQAFDLLPYFGGVLGNVFTHASVGTMARLGVNIANDFGPTCVSPVAADPFVDASPDGVDAADFFEAFVFAGVEGRGVLRNIFLDGNTFTHSHHVDKRFWILEYQTGLSLRVREWRLTWRRVTRSPEFTLDEDSQTYGSVSLSYSRRF